MGHHIVKNKSWLNAKVFYEKIYQKISGHAMIVMINRLNQRTS